VKDGRGVKLGVEGTAVGVVDSSKREVPDEVPICYVGGYVLNSLNKYYLNIHTDGERMTVAALPIGKCLKCRIGPNGFILLHSPPFTASR